MQNRDRNIRRGKFERQEEIQDNTPADPGVVVLGIIAVLAALTIVTKLALGL